jgi:membrane-associated phospholipid phosphatase
MTTPAVARIALVAALAFALPAPIERLDWTVQHAVQSARRPAFEPIMRGATRLTNGAPVFGGLLGVAVFGGPAGVATARAALVALLPVNAAVEATKHSFGRMRPDGSRSRSNASFPSSHAANAASLATVLAWRWRRLMPAFVALAALVSFSRIYLNRHFLSDVLGGVLLGLAVTLVVMAWLRSRGWTWERAARPRA